jgi:DNA mismatch repair protein MutL
MIAAGEVVERPRSVLKELVENALDAGATQIDVEVASGGRKLVAVSDDGSGMSRDDALLSIERHATSKIRDAEDVERVATLGFRGEALGAISSVSRFKLQTKTATDEVGTEVVVSGGKMQDVRDAGCPVGTRIEVRDLFFNVPARRKFLRSQQTELSHIRQILITLSLANPAIAIGLTVDGRQLYSFVGNATIEDRIREVFGADYLDGLKEVEFRGRAVRISGYAGVPNLNRSNRDEQFVFVNGRATSAPVLGYAIREGYHALIPSKRHPSLFLFITLDPSLVDANVHPAKLEVRFRHSGEVRDAIIEGIRAALSADSSTGRTDGDVASAGAFGDPAVDLDQVRKSQVSLAIEDMPSVRPFQYLGVPMIPSMAEGQKTDVDRGEAGGHETGGQDTSEHEQEAPWKWCRILGQIGGLYVLMETEEGYVVMDPHAAHERVLFERFMRDVVSGKVESQGVLVPETVELQPNDATRIRKNIELVRKMGFGISEFGGDTFVIDALPAYFADTPSKILLPDIAHTLERAGERGGAQTWREEQIAQAACKASVRARSKMTLREIEQLVIDLAQAEMPYTCPHGRPTLIFTAFADLNRKFGRGSG